MTNTKQKLGKAVPGLIATVAVVAAGCFHRAREIPPAPSTPAQVIMGAPASVTSQPTPATTAGMIPDAPEPYVDLVLVDAPVRLILQKLAELGKLDLIIPSNINKTLSVQYVHVPVSVALKDVLARSGLRLGTNNVGPLPFDTVTVFYRLPANVDSMSVDAIIHRFGVSRAIAELIVKSRPPR